MAHDESDGRHGRVRALGLMSGGLDSTLAARMLQELGIEVRGLHFSTGFCRIEHRRAVGRPDDVDRPERVRNTALQASADARIPLEIIDVADEFLREVVLQPRYGYGAAMNPCIDCRIFMLRKAAEIARQTDADVVFTGEVVGQRPMSQRRNELELVAIRSGLEGKLLRPLSARKLPPTEAERDGRIDRERLGDLHGRSRREQFRLAGRLDVEDYPTPGGGCCFLADAAFGRRLRDLLGHAGPEGLDREAVGLLKVGRHFRVAHDVKAVIGRDEPESTHLRLLAGDRYWTCQVADGRGAFGLVDGEPRGERSERVASLAARYSRQRGLARVPVRLLRGDVERVVEVRPATEKMLSRWRV